jgi:putative heme-binding domain-containing protein
MTKVSALLALLLPVTLLHANPKAAPVDLQNGRAQFEQHCALCHGINGGGGSGPNLRTPTLQHATNLAEITAVIKNGIPPDMPAGWYLTAPDLADVANYVYSLGRTPEQPLPGDPVAGKAVYDSKGCNGCHILAGQGNGYGPELTFIGASRGVERLRQTLIDPTSSVTPDFQLIEVETAAGVTIRGIKRNEDTLTIELQDQQGAFHSFRKPQLRSLKRLRGETPMPSFADSLTATQLNDIVSYLSTLRHR